ncbi:MAG: bifunctional proline dehydrogenase/L-glutamate gamma-semialdehyde dehydrogenase PutA [Pseudomonadota bacterium]|nr:bifunctional proline dehydrogenase/L-glutamate gamma-semialdehyde dehydrogenase PutA [Pseudomonadota bacterium]
MTSRPFSNFAPAIREPSPLRRQITAAYRRSEPACLADLLPHAEIAGDLRQQVRATATALVTALRSKGRRGGLEGLVQEYSLSSQEGVALMCLAEALLRIPDNATRDALIRDKIASGDWNAHLGGGRSLFVNAATWGLVVTGKLVGNNGDGPVGAAREEKLRPVGAAREEKLRPVGAAREANLGAALTRLIARAGEPVIRRGVDMAMELMGEQFVTGETIAEALKRARKLEAQGFGYSYDMLGEAASTAADAARYLADYERAIHAIGQASAGRGVYGGPGISIKLSALHPRYSRAQAGRVMSELLPRLRSLARHAKHYDIGFNIDAEEADRLEISLDLLESLALDPDLAGWNGLGFVVQAYGKRSPFVIDWLIDLAQRTTRRIMVRLVKGAYWDSEIKRAQVDGLADFPVYTRKVHTDVCYIACARKMLGARDVIFPQFATHNAQTLATIYHLAGPDFVFGDYEFQCLHGMGEPLYEEVVGTAKLARPCRIYAPVGTHETLLAYLVRRLLENGANSSFVHRIGDAGISVAELVADPARVARQIEPVGAPHPAIARPRDIHGARCNSGGIDLSDEDALAALAVALDESVAVAWHAAPTGSTGREPRAVCNPADHQDRVGTVSEAGAESAAEATARAAAAFPAWSATPVDLRAACLERAADALQARMPVLMGLIVREAGKSLPNAIGEVREAIDFLRYYAAEARGTQTAAQQPLGPVVCISPWNFPLAIFTGQVAAALVTGNTVLAKPARETPLIAAQAVRILHESGIPDDVLQFLPGDGAIGGALVARPEIAGVLFTGSTPVAKSIQCELASHGGAPIPLIAETGGQNAMIVDSSALAEQVTADVIASAFDSAGQRCSALRVLCLQDEIADRQLAMIKGALAELAVSNPQRLATDIGPVITAAAQARLVAHIERMRSLGCRIEQAGLPKECRNGTFVAPTIIEISAIAQIGGEVFGPVLHVLRYARNQTGATIAAINATGYGLTFGLHTRLDETIAHVTAQVAAGNIYVNRNVIGAVVGVQPFGGRGLSGTGPKAGGPLYLGRLMQAAPVVALPGQATSSPAVAAFAEWLDARGDIQGAAIARAAQAAALLGHHGELAGPVGERNLYTLHPRGRVLLVPHTGPGLVAQLAAALAAGNQATVLWPSPRPERFANLPASLAEWISALPQRADFSAVLIESRAGGNTALLAELAALDGAIALVQQADADGCYRADWLVEEQSISINTTAAGGNASLMALV